METVDQEALLRATTPVPRATDPADWWCVRYREKLKLAQTLGKKIEIVFFGDSITQNFERESFGKNVSDAALKDYCWLDLGFIGDRTQQMLYLIEHGDFFPLLQPEVVVMLIGTNHFEFNESGPFEAAAGIRRAVESLRRLTPQSKILLLGVLPHAEGGDSGHNIGNRKINEIISAYADDQKIFFADFSPHFIDRSGNLKNELYLDDHLHPSEAGYRVFADLLLPYLARLTQK